MQIYTGNVYGEDLERCKKYGVGIMIASTSSGFLPTKAYREVPCALDNGAFQSYRLGYPFMERFFWKTMEKCFSLGIQLDFIACPDIVCGGYESLDFSVRYAHEKLRGAPRLALVVQDGMVPVGIHDRTADAAFTHLFIGGSVEWKWKSARDWRKFASDHGMKLHIGRCGTAPDILRAQDIGADSVDGTNIARNDNWDVLEKLSTKQFSLFS